ncbi:MAG: lysophospholipid acyltransferase family protein [Chloroflexi bacterium]|nr:lysophospholipid acyltransferase family protein [Chloroflexota bacterium]
MAVLRSSGSFASRFLYQLNRRSAGLIPFELAQMLAIPPADAVHALWPSKRRIAAANFAQVTGLPADDPRVERLVRACFRHFGRYFAEALHLQSWDSETVLDRVAVEGEENFALAADRGRGIVFVSGHMGSTEIAASLAVLRGYQIRAVTEELSAGWLMDWIVRTRQAMGITLVSADGAGLGLIRALRRGGMVAMVIDAGIERPDSIPVQFFGRPALFPSGPARLARLTDAAIVFGLAVRRPGGLFKAYICPPLLPDRERAPDDDIARMTQELARTFEGFVRRYPAQWYAFRRIWADG